MKPAEWLQANQAKCWQLMLFSFFIAAQFFQLTYRSHIAQIPPATPQSHLHIVSLGEKAWLARMLSFWLQSFDSQSGYIVQFDQLNFDHLFQWYERIESLDPYTQYSLLTASRVFIESKDPQQVRQIIAYVHKEFLEAPADRWRWQLDITMMAKHRIQDLDLALQLARDLRVHTKNIDVPVWIRDIEHLILAEQGEIESAIYVIDRLLKEGTLNDVNEIRFLTSKLKALHKKRLEID